MKPFLILSLFTFGLLIFPTVQISALPTQGIKSETNQENSIDSEIIIHKRPRLLKSKIKHLINKSLPNLYTEGNKTKPNKKSYESFVIAGVVLSVLSLFFGPFTGIPAIICSAIALQKIKEENDVDESVSLLAKIGLILSSILTAIWLLYFIIIFAAFFSF